MTLLLKNMVNQSIKNGFEYIGVLYEDFTQSCQGLGENDGGKKMGGEEPKVCLLSTQHEFPFCVQLR